MDRVEYDLRIQELEVLRRSARVTSLIASLTFAVSALAVVASVAFAALQLKSSANQFNKSARASRYDDIVSGLGNSAAAVQQNSMRLLVDYVQDRGNYRDRTAQESGARDAIQVLTAFVDDKSAVKGRSGLSDYESPQPVILSRAIDQLKILADDRSLGSHTTDVSRGNFHGVSLPYFAPNGSFLAVATDFRIADLHHLDLRKKPASLRLAFFTCASLQHAQFGTADLDGADLSGANLDGANLSGTNVTAAQLTGATISEAT